MFTLLINEGSPQLDALFATTSGGIGTVSDVFKADEGLPVSVQTLEKINGVITDTFETGDVLHVGIGDGVNPPVCYIELTSASPATGTLAINTAGMVALFAATVANQIQLQIGVARTRSTVTNTVFSAPIIIHRSVIDIGTAVPTPSILGDGVSDALTHSVNSANGIAVCDGTGKLPSSILPNVGGTITANSTPTSGYSAGDILISDGAKAQKFTPGTGVGTALAISIGSVGSVIVNGGTIGAPSDGNFASGTFTWPTFNQNTSGNAATATSVALSGITGLGAGIATALAINTGTAGAPALYSGDLGTPTAGDFTGGTFKWPTFNQNTTGNASTATLATSASQLQTTRTIGGSNFNGTANVTSFPSPGAIGGTTPAAGTFTNLTGRTDVTLGVASTTTGIAKFKASGNANTVNLTIANSPAADCSVIIPATSGTLITTGDTGTVTNAMLAGSIANSKLATDPLNASNMSSGTLSAARGGTGVSNAGTLTNASNTTITGGGTLVLGGYTATVSQTGTLPILATNTPVTSSYTPANDTWVAWVRADDIAGTDGTALTTVALSSGSASSFTGTATLKTGANGINSHNVMLFNGTSDKLSTTTGGASLTGDWYMAAVVKLASTASHQDVMSWGDQVTAKRRSMHVYPSPNEWTFIGQFADLLSPTATSTSAAFIEIQNVGGNVSVFVNGTQAISGIPSATLLAYSSAVLRIGANPGGSEFLSGSVAEVFFANTPPVPANRRGLRSYIATRYGISLTNATPATTLATNSTSGIGQASMVTDNGTNVVVGLDPTPISVNGAAMSSYGALYPATLTVNGAFAASMGDGEHLFINSSASRNTACFWNKNASGPSAVRFLLPGTTGQEMGAAGVLLNLEPFGATTYGSTYLEFNDNASGGANYGIGRFIQSKANTPSLRQEFKQNGDIAFYWQNTYASGNNTAFLTFSGNNGATTNLTASTESIVFNHHAATRTWATGALTTQRNTVFDAPTLAFAGASTVTTAVNVDIADPIAGTNATLTNKYALRAASVNFTGNVTIGDGANVIFNTTTGTKIGTAASQKIGFWNATPIVQPTTSVGSATVVSPGAGSTIKTDDTFDGYTLAQVVKAFRNAGLLA